jgi:hypothetical protein
MLALAMPAQAEVVVTNTNLPFTYLSNVRLDLNNDGVSDFRFSVHLYDDFSFSTLLTVAPLAGGELVATPGFRGPYASALVQGAQIGPQAHFTSGYNSLQGVTIERIRGTSRGIIHFYGNWNGSPHNRFLGVKFLINGETHYGWVRLTLTVNRNSPLSGAVTGYAYETIANKAILAGNVHNPQADVQPANHANNPAGPSLGLLALGADAMPLWRRPASGE